MRLTLRLALLALFAGALAQAQEADLVLAAQKGDLTEVNTLLKSGADVNATLRGPINRGKTALIFASQNGNLEIVKTLLAARANVNQRDGNGDGKTALFFASKANPDEKGLGGQTELVRAINTNKPEIALALLKGGASVATIGLTPLMAAAGKSGPGSLELVQAILAAHANVNTGFGGRTPLGIAASSGSIDIVQALLARNLYADVDSKQSIGDTPLTIAAGKGRADVVRLLLAAKADINAKNDDQDTALSLAVRNNHPDVAAILRSAGAVE